MAHAVIRDEFAPAFEMNTTPLIDVMLVLLVMFIITIPIQTHAVKVDSPSGRVIPQPDPVKNLVVVTNAGATLWNGVPIDMAGLRANLAATRRMHPLPELQLRPEAEARYALVDEVLAETKRARIERMGFIGNEAYRSF